MGRKLLKTVQTITTFRNPLADHVGTRRGPPLVSGAQFENRCSMKQLCNNDDKVYFRRPHQMYEMWTIAIDDPVAWCVCLSVVCLSRGLFFYSFARWRLLDVTITT